jgi:hypothetical protein
MIKNFHFKMLIGLSISAFMIGFIYMPTGSKAKTDRIRGTVGGLFCMVGLFAGLTATSIRSINRRLDKAGIADDPQYPTSNGRASNQKGEQDASSESDKHPI